MNPERRQILQLLSEKRISVQESLDLFQELDKEAQATENSGMLAEPEAEQFARPENTAPAANPPDSLFEYTAAYLVKTFSRKLNIDPSQIDLRSTYEPYGVDSVAVIELIDLLEKDFGPLPKILLFEYNSIEKLTRYLLLHHHEALEKLFGINEQVFVVDPEALFGFEEANSRPLNVTSSLGGIGKRQHDREPKPTTEDIAIIGVSGRYPLAGNLREFWRNLKSGRSCITEIPASRWDHSQYYHPDSESKSYSKWGGFIEDVDKFDPLFFGISPKEAEQTDPQERLFLEVAWETLEDAGYTREELVRSCQDSAGADVGVFVGVMYAPYQLLATGVWARPNEVGPNSSHWSIPNRVSYLFNFQGPSLAVDTACSASLTAIHLACESIKRGECGAAIAGGVTLIIHPSQFIPLTNMKMLSRDDKCRVFGEGANGFVDGEGVGAVLLRPLSEALQHGDQIYGVIKSSSINAGGKTSGYTVPNPSAQADLIAATLERANIDPGTISYVEAHGTGTMLGDPIEIAGLTKAFQRYTQSKQYCAVGSTKSNIGHLQAAAGVVGLTKVLLQMKYQQIVPSLNAQRLNPLIDFKNSPFYVAQTLTQWVRPSIRDNDMDRILPRRAGVSSFGIGGANAHLIVEEFEPRQPQGSPNTSVSDVGEIILLSARDEERLREYAQKLREWITADDENERPSLGDIAYTLQVGREAMEARLALIVRIREEIVEKLDNFLNHKTDADILFSENIDSDNQVVSLLKAALAESDLVRELCVKKHLPKLAALWVAGFKLDWAKLHETETHARVSLPTYPFSRERYWIEMQEPATRPVADNTFCKASLPSTTQERSKIVNEPRQLVTAPESKMLDPSGVSPVKNPSEFPTPTTRQIRQLRVREIQERIKSSLVEALKMDPWELEMDKPLSDYGINSLVGVSIIQDLGTWLGREIKVTMLWEYPTIRSLSDYLADLEAAPGPAAHNIPSGQTRGNAGTAVLKDTRDLHSNTDADALENDPLIVDPLKAAQSLDANELLENLDQLSEGEVDTYLAELLARDEMGEQAYPQAGRPPEKWDRSEIEEEQLFNELKRLSEEDAVAYFNNLLPEMK